MIAHLEYLGVYVAFIAAVLAIPVAAVVLWLIDRLLELRLRDDLLVASMRADRP